MKSLLKLSLITLLILSSCKKSDSTSDTQATNKVTLTAIVNLNPGFTSNFSITDATTSDNPILFTQNNVSGSNSFTYQVSQARTLGLDFYVLNPKVTNNQVGTITFSVNGTQLKVITIIDNTPTGYTHYILGITP